MCNSTFSIKRNKQKPKINKAKDLKNIIKRLLSKVGG